MSAPQVPAAARWTRRRAQEAVARQLGLGTATWRALGTTAQLLVAEPDAMPEARAAVDRVVDEVDSAASRFRPDSELSRLNSCGPDWQPVSPLLGRLLRVALDAAQWSDGSVDPTVGAALVELGYDRTFRDVPPDGPWLSVAVQPAPGWQRIELDDAGGRVRKPAGVLLDLGATAKGMASDLAAEAAARVTSGAVLVNLGGDMRAIGSPHGGWSVLVTDDSDPDGPAQPADGQTVSLQDGGLATSSSAARRWRRGGSVIHHLIDPRSGLPCAGPWRTVSVWAPTCVLANTASTAAMILGDAAPGWLAERGFAARLAGSAAGTVTVGRWPSDPVKEF